MIRRGVWLVLLLAALPLAAQDTATLDGEPAIRFLAGHGHLTNYCEGELWITATRIRFDGLTVPRHSFDYKRDQVKDVHPGSAFGFHYLKIDAGDKTYRMGIYPNLQGQFGDRFEFFARAFRDFSGAYDEVRRAESERKPPAGLLRVREEKDGPVLEMPVVVGEGVLWFSGKDGVAVWTGAKAGKESYGELRQTARGENSHARLGVDLETGTLEVSATHVRLTNASGKAIPIDEERDQMRVLLGAGGSPQAVVAFRRTGRVTLLLGGAAGEGVELYDATPLLRALGREFPQVVEEVRKSSAQ